MEYNNTHDIIVIIDSITAASKILVSKVNPFQNIVILLATKIKSYLNKDTRNTIHFWYCPSKAEWPRHKLVDNQVKANNNSSMLPSKNSYLFSKKKECNDMLKEWQTFFSTSQKKGQIFLDFKDKKQHVIIPTYAKGSSWLPSIEFTSTLCAQFTHMTTGHVPIGKYQQCFFPNSLISCPCGQAAVQTCKHIVMQYDLHDLSSRPCNIIINSFVHFLVDNPTAFSFNNG